MLGSLLPAIVDDPMLDLAARYEVKIEQIAAPLDWKGKGYSITAKPPTADQMAKYGPLFQKEWSLYPASYVKKAVVHRIVFGIELAVDGQLRAAVPAFDGDTMYYDPERGSLNPSYQRSVIHHEFFHMVDWRMKRLNPDAQWEKLNLTGFKYGSGGAKMQTGNVGALTDQIPGFLTQYGTAAVEEDKAELFAHMIVDPEFVKERSDKDPVIKAKIGLLRDRLAKFDPAMGDEFWKKIPTWSSQRTRLPFDAAIVNLCYGPPCSPQPCFTLRSISRRMPHH